MFDLDLSKMALVGMVALVAIGPKDLPAALRVAGRLAAQLHRLRGEVRKVAEELMTDASLDREIGRVRDVARFNLALDPRSVMRGGLAPDPAVAERGTVEFASAEMQAYLAPETLEPLSPAEAAQPV